MKQTLTLLLLLSALPAQADEPSVSKAKAEALLKLNLLHRTPAKTACPCEFCECETCCCNEEKCGYCEGEKCCQFLKGKCLAALKQKPLFVWVGMEPDAKIQKQFPDAVHVTTKHYQGSNCSGLYVPAGNKEFWFSPKWLDVQTIRGVLQTGKLPTNSTAPRQVPNMNMSHLAPYLFAPATSSRGC